MAENQETNQAEPMQPGQGAFSTPLSFQGVQSRRSDDETHQRLERLELLLETLLAQNP